MDLPPQDPQPTSQRVKSQRVLACILCQQRKIKCDRRSPCGSCVKSRAQCVPATLTQRRKRRRFPERELLDRLRSYEELLRQSNIDFQPLHKSPNTERAAAAGDSDEDNQAEHGNPSTSPTDTNPGNDFVTKNFWHAMGQGFRGSGEESDSSLDDRREKTVRNALKQSTTLKDNLLFGPSALSHDLKALHPTAVQIFRVWQLYLDNINPLLKVTHTSSLQRRIIEAAGDLKTLDPPLEALMFAIYCITIMSLTAEECQNIFLSNKEEMEQRFRTGCQQALWQSQFLRTDSRDCLTAYCLYLISIRGTTIPQALSPMIGVAIHIAKRMGLHNESSLAKCDALESEMRRRLWWFLVLFDARIGEMAGAKSSSLDPTWDCKIPLNVNDSDLHPEMKRPPTAHAQNTEAVFIIVRSEIADFVRHATFYLDYINPVLKYVVKQVRSYNMPDADGLADLEERMEKQYLRACDVESPPQFMTAWTGRALLARYRLLEYHSRVSYSSSPPTDAEREAATGLALKMLECDTKIMTSPLTKGFVWLSHVYFPFMAYNHIVQDLRRRPLWAGAQNAWEVMSQNHEAHQMLSTSRVREMENPILRVFAEMIHRAWEACEKAAMNEGTPLAMPRIISVTKSLLSRDDQAENDTGMSGFAENTVADLQDLTGFASSVQDHALQDMSFDPRMQDTQIPAVPDLFSGMYAQNYVDGYSYQWGRAGFAGWPAWRR